MPTAGRFLLCLHSHMPYVLSHGKSPHGTDWLNESAAECYLPILDVLDRLHNEGIKPRWVINLSPILIEQLDDPSFKSGFEAYCQEKIDAAISDQEEFSDSDQMWMQGVALMWQRFYTRALVQFKHKWDRSIVQGFAYFQDIEAIEIITCGATHGYLPLAATDESVRMQVKLGVETYRSKFRRDPKGIWLPECAYRPAYEWAPPVGESKPYFRAGVESILAENGLSYFFVDSHMIRGGEPLGTYAANFPQLAELFERGKTLFTPPEEFRSEYEHYALPNGVVCFARDPFTTVKVWSGDVGYPGDPAYLEFHKQHYPGRLRYWRISENKADLGAKQPYVPWNAFEKIAGHAHDLVQIVKSTLVDYKEKAGRTGCLVAMYDTELFGHWWWEGPEFLYEMAKAMHAEPDLESVSASDVLAADPPQHQITLPEGSWGEGGYHYIWLNEQNAWTWEQLYPAQAKMRELATAKLNPKSEPYATQAGRELLLAEASDWQFLISTFAARDYAEIRFSDHIERFNQLVNIISRIEIGTEPTVADVTFLKDCQEKDACFAELDFRQWAPKDSMVGSSSASNN